MAGIKTLLGCAFLGSVGITLLIIACAVPNNWWPFFNVIFYVLAPLPTMCLQRMQERSGERLNLVVFITMGFIISAFALPIVLARAPPMGVISLTSCFLTLASSLVIFVTILIFFLCFQQDDDYSFW